jgi:hypothetical protein
MAKKVNKGEVVGIFPRFYNKKPLTQLALMNICFLAIDNQSTGSSEPLK